MFTAFSKNEKTTERKIYTKQQYNWIEKQIKNVWRNNDHASINPK